MLDKVKMPDELKMPDLDAMRQDIQDVIVMRDILKGMILSDLDEMRMQEEVSLAAAHFIDNMQRRILQNTAAETLRSLPYGMSETDRFQLEGRSAWDILQDRNMIQKPCGTVAKAYAAEVREKISVAMLLTAEQEDSAGLCMAIYKYKWMEKMMPMIRDYYEDLDIILEIVGEIRIPENRLAWRFSSLRVKKKLAEADRFLLKAESMLIPAQLDLLAKRRAEAMNPEPSRAIAYVRNNAAESFELLKKLGYAVGSTDPFQENDYDMAG